MLFLSVRQPRLLSCHPGLTVVFEKSIYPAIMIIIACTQVGQEGYNTRPDASGGLHLTTIHLSVGENTADINLPTVSTPGESTTYSEITPSGRR